MKCQKCGKSEVNFHYSSNVNGCVTETHLCSECATESGYDIRQMFDFDGIFDSMLPMRGKLGGFMPVAIPFMQSNAFFPFAIQPHIGMSGSIGTEKPSACGCGCATTEQKENVEVDEKLSQRRKLNMQMRAAIEKEEFEKAAELRDKIKELEA